MSRLGVSIEHLLGRVRVERGSSATKSCLALCAAYATLGLGCGEPSPAPPTAVITATPSTICYQDDYETRIKLSGRDSQQELQLASLPPLPGQEPELAFFWAFSGAAYEIEDEDPSGAELRLSTAGDRPLHVRLTVTSPQGGLTTSVYSLPITMPPQLSPCEGGSCAGSNQCVSVDDRELCVPATECEYHMHCPPCFRCDDALGICVPRSEVP